MKEIPVGRAYVILRCRVRAAPKDFLADEPLIVVFVELGFESGIGNVVRGSPFPDIADHLIATVGALTFRVRPLWRDAPQFIFKQISPRNLRAVITPRKAQLIYLPGWNACSLFPFRFGGQAFASPLCERRCFVETYVRHRFIGLIFDSVTAGEVSDQPLAAVQLPIQRPLPRLPVNAVPSLCKPPAKIRVAAGANELQILAIADE